MTIGNTKPGGWSTNEKFTSPQATAITTAVSQALDRTVAGDTLAGRVVLSGAGRIVPRVVNAPNADATFQVADADIVRVPSSLSAGRVYQLGNTGATDHERIVISLNDGVAYTVTVTNHVSAPIADLSRLNLSMPAWVEFEYTAAFGWRALRRGYNVVVESNGRLPAGIQRNALIDNKFGSIGSLYPASSTTYLTQLEILDVGPVATGDYVDVDATGFVESTGSFVAFARIVCGAASAQRGETKVVQASAVPATIPFAIMGRYAVTADDVTAGTLAVRVQIRKEVDSPTTPDFALRGLRARLMRP